MHPALRLTSRALCRAMRPMPSLSDFYDYPNDMREVEGATVMNVIHEYCCVLLGFPCS